MTQATLSLSKGWDQAAGCTEERLHSITTVKALMRSSNRLHGGGRETQAGNQQCGDSLHPAEHWCTRLSLDRRWLD